MKLILFCFLFSFSFNCFAWGKRGHESVGSLAAQLLSQVNSQALFLKNHSFDMGYYNNAPDLVWKADDATYKKEFSQHFIDLEAYDRAFKKSNAKPKWNSDRNVFFKNYPEIENQEGRVLWRIHELNTQLTQITEKLKKNPKDKKILHQLQEQWLVTAGVLGHYIADLAQPLHVSENYDGQMTEQKGLHHWFEEDLVDELYPSFSSEVLSRASQRWSDFLKKNKDTSAFDLSLALAKNSSAEIPALLALDKKIGRESVKTVVPAYKELIIERLTTGVLHLAFIWNAQLGWKYDGQRFYNFSQSPTYIEPSKN